MTKDAMSNLEICKMAFDMLSNRGYKPLLDANEPSVACAVNGAELLISEAMPNTISFEYGLDLGRAISPEGKEEMYRALDEQNPVIFEFLHIYERDVELCTYVPAELVSEDIIEDFISAPDQEGGIVEFIRSIK